MEKNLRNAERHKEYRNVLHSILYIHFFDSVEYILLGIRPVIHLSSNLLYII